MMDQLDDKVLQGLIERHLKAEETRDIQTAEEIAYLEVFEALQSDELIKIPPGSLPEMVFQRLQSKLDQKERLIYRLVILLILIAGVIFLLIAALLINSNLGSQLLNGLQRWKFELLFTISMFALVQLADLKFRGIRHDAKHRQLPHA